MHPVEDAVAAEIAREGAARVYVAFSGGLDSTALLSAAHAVLDGGALAALHANHGLAADAAAWQAHCRRICAELDVPFTAATLVLADGNVEAQARAARYAFFGEHVGAAGLLLLGHHADDFAETALLRLFQGRGLMNMADRGALGAGRFARPLLGFTRADLETYVRDRGLDWIEDPSNRDQALDRNFIRHEVLPRLRARWPDIERSIGRVSTAAMHSEAVLQRELSARPNRLPVADLPESRDMAVAWLRAYLMSRGHFSVSDKALVELHRQLGGGRACELAVGTAMLGGYAGDLHYEPRRPAPPGEHAHTFRPGAAIDLGWALLEVSEAGADEPLAFARPAAPRLAFRQGGERLRAHAGGPSRTLKTLFVDSGVPPWRRDAWPLLFDGDELVCVPDVAARVAVAGGECWRARLVEK